MKKAFDANVSRAKPRVRLGSLMTESALSAATVESLAQQVAHEEAPVIPSVETMDLGSALKLRAQARAARSSAAEMLHEAISSPVADEVSARQTWAAPVHEEPAFVAEQPQAYVAAPVEPAPQPRAFVEPVSAPAPRAFVEPVSAPAPRAHAEPPPAVTEVQTAPAPNFEAETIERRERLRERLKAVRENPRPEPLPDTVAEAGVLAVERISALQSELTKARAMNLALAQDLEAARRQAERATEEARLRMDEAKRLSSEMNGRVTLLSELERELESLEGERNESLLALQESRQVLELREREKQELVEIVAKKDQEIDDSLAEEERLAAELESAQETMGALRRSSDALKGERDTLARQVSELTRERAELLEARKALEAVHRALSSASMR
ncbi:MAG: extensin-like protein [Archangium sp.]|nr:extensin-like protein [Archangium sp.]